MTDVDITVEVLEQPEIIIDAPVISELELEVFDAAEITIDTVLAYELTFEAPSNPEITVIAPTAQEIDVSITEPRDVILSVGGGIGGGSGGDDEVYIGPTAPPPGLYEIWIDTLTEAGGLGAEYYEHTQALLATDWVVKHNMNRHPVVAARDAADSVIYGSIHHDSANQLTIHFATTCTGKAYCT